jgi:very-short-patch-repair endonuclease
LDKTAFARHLRRTKTIPERKLWRELRRLNEFGFHFRQQFPIGNYFADFAELSSRLIVEIDGDDHAMPHVLERDVERSRWLESQGFRVLRFGNRDVLQNLPGVLAAIRLALTERVFPVSTINDEAVPSCQPIRGSATPTPNPSPQVGGEFAIHLRRPL